MTKTVVDPSLDVQTFTLTEDGLKLKTPFAMLIAGPSQSGKSEFIYNLVKYRKDVCTTDFSRIIYCQASCFAQKNQLFFRKLQEEYPQAESIQGLPNIHELHLHLNNLPTLLLVDDLMMDVVKSKGMVDLVTNEVHNYNISVVFVFQNYFARGPYGNCLVRNCPYKVLFYNRGETMELRNISSHTVDSPKFLGFCFKFLKKNFPSDPSQYILIDSHLRSNLDELWIRSHIFPRTEGGEIKPLIFFVN